MMTFGKSAITRAWALAALGLLIAALVVAFLLMGPVRATMVTSTAPTPCPDTIACHVLKRMPKQP